MCICVSTLLYCGVEGGEPQLGGGVEGCDRSFHKREALSVGHRGDAQSREPRHH